MSTEPETSGDVVALPRFQALPLGNRRGKTVLAMIEMLSRMIDETSVDDVKDCFESAVRAKALEAQQEGSPDAYEYNQVAKLLGDIRNFGV